MNQQFHVYQNFIDSDGSVLEELLFVTHDETIAQDEADRINTNLANSGVPGYVSSAYVK